MNVMRQPAVHQDAHGLFVIHQHIEEIFTVDVLDVAMLVLHGKFAAVVGVYRIEVNTLLQDCVQIVGESVLGNQPIGPLFQCGLCIVVDNAEQPGGIGRQYGLVFLAVGHVLFELGESVIFVDDASREFLLLNRVAVATSDGELPAEFRVALLNGNDMERRVGEFVENFPEAAGFENHDVGIAHVLLRREIFVAVDDGIQELIVVGDFIRISFGQEHVVRVLGAADGSGGLGNQRLQAALFQHIQK